MTKYSLTRRQASTGLSRSPQLVLALVCLLWVALGAANASRLEGEVVTEEGDPVAGALVTATSAPGPQSTRPVSLRVGTRADGQFTFASIPAGNYKLCVQAKDETLLNSCAWTDEPPMVNIAEDEFLADVHIELQSGQVVVVEIEDSEEILESTAARRNRPSVKVGVFSFRGLFHPAKLKSKKDKKREYTVMVPYEKNVKLLVNGRKLDVFDEKDVKIKDDKAVEEFKVSKDKTPKTYKFKVKAVK